MGDKGDNFWEMPSILARVTAQPHAGSQALPLSLVVSGRLATLKHVHHRKGSTHGEKHCGHGFAVPTQRHLKDPTTDTQSACPPQFSE